MEREFLKILESVRDKKQFKQFLAFCISQLEMGFDTQTVWENWKKRTN